jgi:7,8-dihydroneopterin aldolase/epimerase/oxygenase
MSDYIRITGIEVFAHHGVFDSEKQSGQTFLVDVSLFLDLSEAAQTDQLDRTVNYGEISQQVHDLVAETQYNLIEKVGEEVAAMILKDRRIDAVEVTIHKPSAPIAVPFGDVSVTILRP